MVKHVYRYGFIAMLSAVLLSVPITTSAQEDIAEQTVEATTLETTATESQTTSDDKSAGREARIKAYKEKTTAKIAESKARRVESRCAAAQGKITSLRARVQGIVTKRQQSYAVVSEKLDILIEQLQAAEIDTTVLETARSDVRADLALLSESMAAYDTVLADLEAMDCEADPQIFTAALESAREIQKALREQAQEFRRFASAELRTAIQETKAQLATATQEQE